MITAPSASRQVLTAGAIFIVLVVAVGSWRWWDQSRNGEFEADPSYCALVSPLTVHRLIPNLASEREDTVSCTWAAPREKRIPRANVHLLALRMATVDTAQRDISRERDEYGKFWERGTLEALSGLGDEAFVRFRETTDISISAQVMFRRSNMVVSVQYSRSDNDRAKARAGAIDAARDAMDRL